MKINYVPQKPTYIPEPSNPVKNEDYGTCSKCGLKMSKVMMYVCQHLDCPVGLGPRGIL